MPSVARVFKKNQFLRKKWNILAYVTSRVPMSLLYKCQPIWSSRLASYSEHTHIYIYIWDESIYMSEELYYKEINIKILNKPSRKKIINFRASCWRTVYLKFTLPLNKKKKTSWSTWRYPAGSIIFIFHIPTHYFIKMNNERKLKTVYFLF